MGGEVIFDGNNSAHRAEVGDYPQNVVTEDLCDLKNRWVGMAIRATGRAYKIYMSDSSNVETLNLAKIKLEFTSDVSTFINVV